MKNQKTQKMQWLLGTEINRGAISCRMARCGRQAQSPRARLPAGARRRLQARRSKAATRKVSTIA